MALSVLLILTWSARVGPSGVTLMDNIPEPGLIFWLTNCCSGGTGPNSSTDESGPRTTSAPSNNPESPPLA